MSSTTKGAHGGSHQVPAARASSDSSDDGDDVYEDAVDFQLPTAARPSSLAHWSTPVTADEIWNGASIGDSSIGTPTYEVPSHDAVTSTTLGDIQYATKKSPEITDLPGCQTLDSSVASALGSKNVAPSVGSRFTNDDWMSGDTDDTDSEPQHQTRPHNPAAQNSNSGWFSSFSSYLPSRKTVLTSVAGLSAAAAAYYGYNNYSDTAVSDYPGYSAVSAAMSSTAQALGWAGSKVLEGGSSAWSSMGGFGGIGTGLGWAAGKTVETVDGLTGIVASLVGQGGVSQMTYRGYA